MASAVVSWFPSPFIPLEGGGVAGPSVRNEPSWMDGSGRGYDTTLIFIVVTSVGRG